METVEPGRKENGTSTLNRTLPKDVHLEEIETPRIQQLSNEQEASNNFEGSATDSGVSNASSLTLDCAIPVKSNSCTIKSCPQEVSLSVSAAPDFEHEPTSDPTGCKDSSSKAGPFSNVSVSKRNVLKATRSTDNLEIVELGLKHHGISSLSLEVNTSGEQLNLLAEGLGSSAGSLSGCGGDLEVDVISSRVTPNIVYTPSGGSSRCSSSMGYLEPRPPRPVNSEEESPSNSSNHGDQSLSPKEIQKQLLVKVQSLGPSCDSVEEESNTSASTSPSPQLPRSRSSQSLKSSGEASRTRGLSLGSLFRRKNLTFVRSADHTSQTMLAASSTTGLILHNRPQNLPAKSAVEERKHQKMYEQMMAAARKKELQKVKAEVHKEKQRRLKDKAVSDSLKEWSKILPKWESLHNSRKVRDLWWQGLPPGVRGDVWKRAIGNDLNVSQELYVINLRRCKERLALVDQRDRSDSTSSLKSISREQSVEIIHLDVLRTFPTLGFFQEGGPLSHTLHDILGAYACYRPDIGYVQGMSFLAAVLLLNMEAADAFICLANLLNRPSYLAFFKVDHALMRPYFDAFNILLQDSLPKLSAHFSNIQFSAEYYLIEWIFTIYTRTLPLDIACRVWDMFCRDGDAFLFRTALGILRLHQAQLLELLSIEEVGQYLGNLPANMDSDTLFDHIEAIHLASKRFNQHVQQQQRKTSNASDSITVR